VQGYTPVSGHFATRRDDISIVGAPHAAATGAHP
jgi:hypothetical protein